LRSSGSGTTLDGVVIALPLVLLLLVWGVTSGAGSNFVVLLPILVMLGAGAVVVTIAMKDGRPRSNPKVRQLPTDHLRRHMHRALRPKGPRRQQGRDKTTD
jgi:hypothetical protein